MNKSQLKPDKQLKRHERLQHLYDILVQLVMHEGRFISERTNNFLLFNSILFTGFILLLTPIENTDSWISTIKILLPAAGLVISVLHSVSIARTINAADFWRSSIGLIEKDADFWYPGKTKKDIDMDIFSQDMEYINDDLKISKIKEFAQQARFITIATSPFFIDQKIAIERIKKIF